MPITTAIRQLRFPIDDAIIYGLGCTNRSPLQSVEIVAAVPRAS